MARRCDFTRRYFYFRATYLRFRFVSSGRRIPSSFVDFRSNHDLAEQNSLQLSLGTGNGVPCECVPDGRSLPVGFPFPVEQSREPVQPDPLALPDRYPLTSAITAITAVTAPILCIGAERRGARRLTALCAGRCTILGPLFPYFLYSNILGKLLSEHYRQFRWCTVTEVFPYVTDN